MRRLKKTQRVTVGGPGLGEWDVKVDGGLIYMRWFTNSRIPVKMGTVLADFAGFCTKLAELALGDGMATNGKTG